MHERRVRAPGELAQPAVVDAGAEVVLVADHRRARGAADRLLDLGLDRRERALHDLDEDRVDHRCHHHVAEVVDARREARVDRQRRAELLDDRGPAISSPAPSRSRAYTGASCQRSPKKTGRLPARGRRSARERAASVRALHRPDAGDAQVHPLDDLARVVAIAVAVRALVRVVEARLDLLDERARRSRRPARARGSRTPGRSSAGRRRARIRSPVWPWRSSAAMRLGLEPRELAARARRASSWSWRRTSVCT